MIAPRIAVATRCLRLPIRQALHTAARLEAHGVQVDLRTELAAAELSDTGVRHLRKMLDDLNLRVGSAAFPTRRGYAAAEDLARRIDATVAAMRLASRLGARTVVVTLGDVPGRGSPERAILADALAVLAEQALHFGVQLAAACPAVAPAEAADALAAAEGAIGVDLNPAELIRCGQRPAEYAGALGVHVVHVYATDAVRGLGAERAVEVQLGRGSAEMPDVLAALEEFGYRGWITIDRAESPRTVEEVGDAVKFLRAL